MGVDGEHVWPETEASDPAEAEMFPVEGTQRRLSWAQSLDGKERREAVGDVALSPARLLAITAFDTDLTLVAKHVRVCTGTPYTLAGGAANRPPRDGESNGPETRVVAVRIRSVGV